MKLGFQNFCSPWEGGPTLRGHHTCPSSRMTTLSGGIDSPWRALQNTKVSAENDFSPREWFFIWVRHTFTLSPNSRWVLNRKAGSGEVEREARQPRARQRHLRRGEPPAPRIMMSGEVFATTSYVGTILTSTGSINVIKINQKQVFLNGNLK